MDLGRFNPWRRRPPVPPIIRPRPTTTTTAVPTPSPGPVDPDAEFLGRFLDAHNQFRQANGRSPFRVNPLLVAAARNHDGVMVARREMSHQLSGEPDMRQRIESTGYRWSRIGENIAYGQISIEAVMATWMNSEGHRANILGPFAEMGGVVATTPDGVKYWCVDFGSPGAGMQATLEDEDVQTVILHHPEVDASSLTIELHPATDGLTL